MHLFNRELKWKRFALFVYHKQFIKFESYVRQLAKNEPETTSEEQIDDPEDLEDQMFVPIKKHKSTLDHEILLYNSMYENASGNNNPLDFWKSAEKVYYSTNTYILIFRLFRCWLKLHAKFCVFQQVRRHQNVHLANFEFLHHQLEIVCMLNEFNKF